MRLLLAAVAAGAIALSVWAWREDWPKYRRLQSHGRAVDGWVTAREPERGLIHYSFNAQERVYSGVGRSPRELAEGDRIVVFYIPGNPAISAPGDPQEYIGKQNHILAAAVFLGSALIGLFL